MNPRLALPLLAAALTLGASVVLGIAACTSERPQPVEQGSAISLRELPFAELEIPESSRPNGEAPPDRIEVRGPWRYLGTNRRGQHKYATRVPIRPRGLFFFRPKPGMRLLDAAGNEVEYDQNDVSGGTLWSHDRKQLIILQEERNPPPGDDAFVMEYPRATEREASLNFGAWKQAQSDDDPSKHDFVWTQIQDDWDARNGLLLPAPGVAAWDVTVPEAGELHFVSGLVEPEVRTGGDSDGAKLLVEVEVDGKVRSVGTVDLAVHRFEPQRFDLSAWSGKDVRLRVRTEPLAHADYDYAFLGEPVLSSRLADPVRVVMIFIDTLRPDHMSLYGYERDTSAAVDTWAEGASVFENARSVAPWTLPSARAIITGRQPEEYQHADTLPAILREDGWATAFIAGNVYLSANFDMHRDWGFHRVGLYPMGNEVTDDALEWLEQTDGQNGLIQVHYMDPHLPYQEPLTYRRMYAGSAPDGVREEFFVKEVRRHAAFRTEEGQDYVRDRYDQNIRYTTDQVARILEKLDDNDIVLLFSDHGEEFWEHGAFEHGHTVFDELLRVPLAIKAPGITPSRIDTPVSVLDLAPTILDLLGKSTEALDGRSLVPLMKGDPEAAAALALRPQAFGRPLYGLDRWGVVRGHEKWMTQGGREAMYDLQQDAPEANNLHRGLDGDPGQPFRVWMGEALEREVPVSYRFILAGNPGRPVHQTWALCTVPGGFSHAFMGGNPLDNAGASIRRITDDVSDTVNKLLSDYQIANHPLPDDLVNAVEICWHPQQFGEREMYFVPNLPMDDVGRQLTCSAYQGTPQGGKRITFGIDPQRPTGLTRQRTPLQKAILPQRTILMTHGMAPAPNAETGEIRGNDPELTDMLVHIGYAVPDAEGEAPAPRRTAQGPWQSPCEPPVVQLPTPKKTK